MTKKQIPFKPNHRWDHASERRFPHTETADGCARNEVDCLLCGITKITVMPPQGFPYHEWRTKDGAGMVWTRRPECAGAQPVVLREEKANVAGN